MIDVDAVEAAPSSPVRGLMVPEHNQRVWFVLDLSVDDRRAQRVATFTSRDEAEADVQSRIGVHEIRSAIYKRRKGPSRANLIDAAYQGA